MIDFRDLVIADLAADEAKLVERLALAGADRDAWREMAQAAIHELADITQQHRRLREQHHRLLDEFRTVRAQTMRRAVAA